MSNFYVRTKARVAVPRSKRLRQNGYYAQKTEGGSVETSPKNTSEVLQHLWVLKEPGAGLYVDIDWLLKTDETEQGEPIMTNVTDFFRHTKLINIGTEDEPVWVIDLGSQMIKSSQWYEEHSETAPDPSDTSMYTSLAAREIFVEYEDIIKTQEWYQEHEETAPAPTNLNVYSSLKSRSKFIFKDEPDTVSALITFTEGVKFGNYTAGSSGAAVYKDSDNNWHYEADFLHVRKKLTAEEIEVQRTTHIGGKLLNTPAAMICSSVEDKGTYWRCHFRTEDADGRKIYNQFQVNDQAYVETFNLDRQSGGTSGNHYLWRLVIATGTDYIDISKSDAASGSDAPMAGDYIVQLGNRQNSNRQSAIIDASAGTGAPYIRIYNNIRNYTLPTPRIDLNPTLSTIYANLYTASGDSIESAISTISSATSSASALAASAYNYADSAYSRASAAVSNAAAAQSSADSAYSRASTAINNAAAAQSSADSAYSRAGTAINNAAAAQSAAESAASQASTNAAAISSLDGTVSALSGRFNSQGHLLELSNYMLTADYATMLTSNFNADGTVKSTSSIVTTATYAVLMSSYLNEHGYINSTAGLVVSSGTGSNAFSTLFASSFSSSISGTEAQAIIDARVTAGLSTITLNADQINFSGYTIINGHFIVDDAGNLEISGGIRATNTVYTTGGYNYVLYCVGNTYLYGSLYQVSSTFTTLQAATTSITGTSKLTLSSSSLIEVITSGEIQLEGGLAVWATSSSSGTIPTKSMYHRASGNVSLPYPSSLTNGKILIVNNVSGSSITLSGSMFRGGSNISSLSMQSTEFVICVVNGSRWDVMLGDS